MSMTATARRVGATLRHEVDVNGRHSIVTDEPTSLGGTDSGPAPHELLPATLASCIATMIALYAQTKGWEIGEVSVEVVYDNEPCHALRRHHRLPPAADRRSAVSGRIAANGSTGSRAWLAPGYSRVFSKHRAVSSPIHLPKGAVGVNPAAT